MQTNRRLVVVEFMERIILLVDMNAFYASVHQAVEPVLKGKPVIVGGDPAQRHGIVLAASYEARALGVKTGMTVREARAICPQGIFKAPRQPLYIQFSTNVLNILRSFSPLVEPFSIDEAFLDVTGCRGLFGSPVTIARHIKQRIENEAGILCSVGIGPNKLLAKMAADMQKPDGLTVLGPGDVPRRVWPLPVGKLFGVGFRTEVKLNRLNIHTIGELAGCRPDVLEKRFGLVGKVLYNSAHGIDHSPVDPHSLDTVKSIGHQITLPRDYRGYPEIRVVLWELAEMVGRRVRLGGYQGKTVSLILRDVNFDWLRRSLSFPQGSYSNASRDIYRAAVTLLSRHWPSWKPVRLVGLAVSNLIRDRGVQLDLFGEREKQSQVDRVCDRIKDRFGEDSIVRAICLTGAGVCQPPR